jgi:hypothetical protein
MNRWRQRLAELRGNDPEMPAYASASLHNVQTVQNVQNPVGTGAFEQSEQIEQRTETPARHAGAEKPFARSLSCDIRDGWRERVAQLLSRPCPDAVRMEWWTRGCRGAERFAQQWADQAMRLGWTFDELFAFAGPFADVSRQGAAWFVGDSSVTAVTADAITLRRTSGSVTRIYRQSAREREPSAGECRL